MNFGFIPSLQHMTTVKISLAIYFDKDIDGMLVIAKNLPDTGYHFDRDRHELWKQIEAKAVEKLHLLPDLLKTKVSKYLRPLQEEFLQWLSDHDFLCRTCNHFDHQYNLADKTIISWKSDGTIDRPKTAKNILHCEHFKPESRFAVACTYFLENELLALWHGDEGMDLKSFLNDHGSNAALRFWMKRLQNGSWRKRPWQAEVDGYFKNRRLSYRDKRLRISCFFRYLSWEGKRNYFSYLRWLKGYSDDFLLCLQELNEEERMELISVYPANVLLCYLRWPLQPLFIEMAEQLWYHMSTKQFEDVLIFTIIDNIFKDLEDFDYVGLLEEFWYQSPDSYKRKIKKQKTIFELIDLTLNYDEESESLSLPELIEKILLEST